jgi:glucokinase
MLLAADIGGTKTELALFDEETGPHHFIARRRFPSPDYHSLEEIILEFLAQHGASVRAMAAGIAGPVRDNRVQVTNLPWVVDAERLSQVLNGVPIKLMNDLEAIAHAIPALEAQDIIILKDGVSEPSGPIGIVAPGTGLGESFLIWSGGQYRPVATEGGHTDFAPATDLELQLLSYLMPRLGHVSYERVCSGIGMPNLYGFLRDSGRYPEPDWLRSELAAAPDATRVIVQSGVEGRAEICLATLELFASILGSEAGNLFLKLLATGGLYLAGGLPPRILPILQGEGFLEAFTRKGRFSELLRRVPVYVVLQPATGLIGAANQCLAQLPGA